MSTTSRGIRLIDMTVGQTGMREVDISSGFRSYAEFNSNINYASLQSFMSEIKSKLLIQKYVQDNGLTPYKLSLMADVSTSHTHGALKHDWAPSQKIARRLVNAIPADYAIGFDLDWSNFMPSFVSLNDSNPIWHDHFIKIKHIEFRDERDIFELIEMNNGYINIHKITRDKITIEKSFVSQEFPYDLEHPLLPRFFYPFVLMDIKKQEHENVMFQSPFVLSIPDQPFLMRWFQYNVTINNMLYSMYFPIQFSEIPRNFMWIIIKFYRDLNDHTANSFSGNHPSFLSMIDFSEPDPVLPVQCL